MEAATSSVSGRVTTVGVELAAEVTVELAADVTAGLAAGVAGML